MASSSKTHISSYVFSLVLLFSSLHIHGRDSKFFDKITHSSPSPSPAPVEAETQNGYGLFGRDDESGTPSDGVGGDRYPNYNTGYTNTNTNNELTGESLMSTSNTNSNNNYNSGNERQGTSESWIMDNGKYYYGSTTNDDDNGYTATYNTDLYRPERQRSSDDNYVGGYQTEQKDAAAGSNGGDYYGNNVKYEFDSMEEYDKYQEKNNNGGYWP